MNTTERYLLAMLIIFTLPYVLWRFSRATQWAPLVVVQIVTGIVLGPGVLGAAFPDYYQTVFAGPVVTALNGVAWWAVMLFVFIAGVELDLVEAWRHRRETSITAGCAMGMPWLAGCAAAGVMLAISTGWVGPKASTGQFIAGVGMACSVTALPILVLFMEKLNILQQPLGQRILRYASLDDIAIWAMLALILADWGRLLQQFVFMLAFGGLTVLLRRVMPKLAEGDRWALALAWLLVCALGADICGLHFMVGAFLAGTVIEAKWFDTAKLHALRNHVLWALMPVFFLSTGLRTQWGVGGSTVFLAAGWLLLASVAGKLAGVRLAGRILGWTREESRLIGWLLQTKALIMIIFANVMLDRQIITSDTFTALLLMAVGSTLLTIPMVTPLLAKSTLGRSRESVAEAGAGSSEPAPALPRG